MTWLANNLLTILIFLPLAGAALTLLVRDRSAVRQVALATTLVVFVLSLALLGLFDSSASALYGYDQAGQFGVVQLVQRAPWIEAFNIEYLVGVDGLSLPLVILSTFIFVLACLASWNIQKMPKGFFALFLLLETGVLGVFLSLDFFLFYVFFEVSLLPMYFLIGIWGGARKEYAAIKFFLYTLVGSIALLIVLIGLYLQGNTFDLIRMASADYQQALNLTKGVSITFFLLLMLGFLIKVPSVPVHTWLPDAHVEAPTPISMILAAILLKMGGYGIFRIAYPLFPDIAKELWMVVAVLGVVSIIYGALCAMSQTDFKRLVAYSSISHMGFVVLGAAMMTTPAINGALFMMVAHGITSAALFFVVGVVYERAHHRELPRLGGLAGQMPVYTGLSSVALFANLGLPGLCGFIGEVMVLLGTFGAAGATNSADTQAILVAGGYATPRAVYTLAVIACFGVILTAGYMLWTIQRVFFGPNKPEHAGFPEVDSREVAVLAPLAVLAIVLGVFPVLVFAYTGSTVEAFRSLFL